MICQSRRQDRRLCLFRHYRMEFTSIVLWFLECWCSPCSNPPIAMCPLSMPQECDPCDDTSLTCLYGPECCCANNASICVNTTLFGCQEGFLCKLPCHHPSVSRTRASLKCSLATTGSLQSRFCATTINSVVPRHSKDAPEHQQMSEVKQLPQLHWVTTGRIRLTNDRWEIQDEAKWRNSTDIPAIFIIRASFINRGGRFTECIARHKVFPFVRTLSNRLGFYTRCSPKLVWVRSVGPPFFCFALTMIFPLWTAVKMRISVDANWEIARRRRNLQALDYIFAIRRILEAIPH